MLKTRLIPTLLLSKGRMVKGKQFRGFRDTGDPISSARIYNAQSADELLFLDIEASRENREILFKIIEKVACECFMPLTVGGGVRSEGDVRALLQAGADKVVLTSAVAERPELVKELAEVFGSQCIVAGIDLKRENDSYVVYSQAFRVRHKYEPWSYIEKLEALGAGEIMINSIDRDGMMEGYDLELLSQVKKVTSRPVIACGGAGNFQHLLEAIQVAQVDAVACASLFHFGDNNPIRARAFLRNKGVAMKTV